MAQTYRSPVRNYKFPFELVTTAYQKRLPTCPQIPVFVGSEITREFHSPDGAEEAIERKCRLNIDEPYLVKKVAGIDYACFSQKTALNRRKRTLLNSASDVSKKVDEDDADPHVGDDEEERQRLHEDEVRADRPRPRPPV